MSGTQAPNCYGEDAMQQQRGGRPHRVTEPAHRRRSRIWREELRSAGDKDASGQQHSGMNEGLRALSMLIAGCLCYGFAGWLADRWLGTVLLMPLGIVVGLGLAVYMVTKRYGASGATTPRSGEDRSR